MFYAARGLGAVLNQVVVSIAWIVFDLESHGLDACGGPLKDSAGAILLQKGVMIRLLFR